MLGTPLLRCFKASVDTTKIPGARLHAIATQYIYVGLWSTLALWAEPERSAGYPRKLDREIFADCPSAKIGSLENFRLYGI